ncbi:MAG: GntP family permease [Flavisolibacter sp.]
MTIHPSPFIVFLFLLSGIGIIVLLTAKFRIHAFFALLIACFVVGLGIGLPFASLLDLMKDGFGNIMKSLGLIIVLGTALGVVIEYTGSTAVMASFILKRTGVRQAPLAMSLTGFVVGLPIFCDSGFIVLSGLNHSLSQRKGLSVSVMSVAMATGLYSVHCLIPPHPGALAAAGTLGVDLGRLILLGIIVALPAMLIGYFWARYAGRKEDKPIVENKSEEHSPENRSVVLAFLPVAVPILLIALRSFFTIESNVSGWMQPFRVAGDPVIALSIGILLGLLGKRSWKTKEISTIFSGAAEKAGGILVIIGAGGAFGAVLTAAQLGTQLSETLPFHSMGLFFPFLISFVLKTAQGSSTVAIITASAIVQPLLPALGLTSDNSRLLAVLSMGAGSMMISHANDAYFWVISRFSDLNIRTMIRTYTVATILMGIVSLMMVYLLSLFI